MKLRYPSQIPEHTAAELHRALVEDRVNGIETPILPYILAIRKIADEWGWTKDRVHVDILEEALSLGAKPTRFDGPLVS